MLRLRNQLRSSVTEVLVKLHGHTKILSCGMMINTGIKFLKRKENVPAKSTL